jgi:phospholipid-binding lipoprotein MlaA
MKSKLARYFCLLSILFIFNTQFALAQEIDSQFNFDDEYQGEDFADNEKNDLIYDPFEPVNRKIFAFNEILDKSVVLPVAKQYRKRIPSIIRRSIGNFIDNLMSPFSVLNSALQGDGENAMASFSSFLINTTLGIGGLFDVAGSRKIEYEERDFGQTFGKYGVGSGPFLMLPFLGPSNTRDFSGFVVEKVVSPLSINILQVGGSELDDYLAFSMLAIRGIDTREGLIEIVDNLRADSFDVYATMRSAYTQRRQSLIINID